MTILRRWWWALATVVLLGIGVWAAWAGRHPGVAGEVVEVRRGTVAATVQALGLVRPLREAVLALPAGGLVASVPVQPGDLVAEGDLLLSLHASEHEQAVALAERTVAVRRLALDELLAAPDEAAIRLARARLRRATALRLNAQRDYDEIADDPDADASDEAVALEAAKLEYEQARVEYERVLARPGALEVERAELELVEANTALRRAAERLEQTRLRAPFAGVVLEVNAREGEMAVAGAPLARVADPGVFVIAAEIDEIDVAVVAEGQRAWVRLEAFPGRELEGRLERLMPAATRVRGITVFEAVVTLADDADLRLRAGMGADVTIEAEVREDVLLLPRRAVRQVGRHDVVRVLDGGRVREVAVITGIAGADEIEIVAGLAEGQQVLVD